jgi:hypothetical protein
MTSAVHDLCDRYFAAWQRKDLNAILACLHPDIVFKSPTATTKGRDAYAQGAQRFLPLVERVEVRRTYVAPDGAMIAVDFHCIQPIGLCPTAERLGLKDGLIIDDELFFDSRPFEALARSKAGPPGK